MSMMDMGKLGHCSYLGSDHIFDKLGLLSWAKSQCHLPLALLLC